MEGNVSHVAIALPIVKWVLTLDGMRKGDKTLFDLPVWAVEYVLRFALEEY